MTVETAGVCERFLAESTSDMGMPAEMMPKGANGADQPK